MLSDPGRKIGIAYGISTATSERYVANNAEGRRSAVILDEHGMVLKVLPDLRTVEEQRRALAEIG